MRLRVFARPESQEPTDGFEQPFRSGPLGSDHLDELARVAATGKSIPRGAGARPLLSRFRDNERILRAARKAASEAAARTETLTPDAEWLLDNFFVIEGVLREVRTDLPHGYYDELPVIAVGQWAGLPRVYVLAIALVSHTDSHLDDAQILRFVREFQQTTPLSTGELWAVPTMLRLALVENLRRLAGQMLAARADRKRAARWVKESVSDPALPLPSGPSDPFLVALHQALRDSGDNPPSAVNDWLEQNATDLTELLRREHRRQAANQVSVGNCVTSLRLLDVVDWNEFFERASLVEGVLRAEPTGVYRRQDFATRDRYRRAVERLAKAARQDEVKVATAVVARAVASPDGRTGHVGYYLIAEGQRAFAQDLGCRFTAGEWVRRLFTDHANTVYFGGVAAFTFMLVGLAVVLAAATGAGAWFLVLVGLIVLLPASEAGVAAINSLVCHFLPPRVLPKLDFSAGIQPGSRTVVVIPALLTKPANAVSLCERLELHYLANPDPQLRFALLTDWADAPAEHMPTDDALVAAALDGIRQLNERYAKGGPDRFFLFHRRRLFNPGEGVWMGWERKRGKLDEFNRLLRGAADTSYVVRTGEASALEARFVLTLDADTVLPRDAARRLIATLSHPLNRPVLSADSRSVVAGYGVLQPRVSFLPQTGLRSRFARIFAGSAGIDPYSSASSDVYQDLFGCGTFTGKGLYEVDAFHSTAGRAFPENCILSHDLIESNIARCGLVTDIEVFDEFPAKYHAFAKRDHRWIRGDWQLLPWLGRTVPTPAGWLPTVVTALGQWKVADNLRRSLVSVSLVLLLGLGWTVLPGPGWVWSLVALAILALPLGLLVADAVLAVVLGNSVRGTGRRVRASFPATVGQIGLTAAFLANQAVLAMDAIGRTLWRVFVSRVHLLEWETAAAAEARLGTGLVQFVGSMWPAVVLSGVLAVVVGWLNPAAAIAAAPWLAAWAFSPVIAWWVSRPLREAEPRLSDIERAELRRTARKTWRFFETFVTEGDHWLPPDNFQEDPKGVVAHRTSPTNIGLLLLSNLSAHDLGYITLTNLTSSTGRTFDTLDRLERYRGHFLNWYETTTLRDLAPAYVSTVDSGNLLGCLLAFRNGLADLQNEPIPSRAVAVGLLDTLGLAAEVLPAGTTQSLRSHLHLTPATLLEWDDWAAKAEKLGGEWPILAGEPGFWLRAVSEQIRALRQELTGVCSWLSELRAARSELFSVDGESGKGPAQTHPDGSNSTRGGITGEVQGEVTGSNRLRQILIELDTPTGVRQWAMRLPILLDELADCTQTLPADGQQAAKLLATAIGRSRAAGLASGLDVLCRRASGFADAMDFRFLYNESRHLFSIGYNVPQERLDPAHYDLLASEAALTSYLAIARGVVPRKHWFRLGRLGISINGLPGLISWGGTMFEYLMPRLLLLPARGTMLDMAQKAAVVRQQKYCRANRVPWGISESGFAVLGPEGDYQYQSFGIPGLGLKRGLANDLVVAPYATLLAVGIDARAAVANLGLLRAVGGEGPFGFYEAIDFTPERLSAGEQRRVVKSYMAHHQGMGLCAITNCLERDIHCRRLRAEATVRAAELLLQERVPLDIPEVRTAEEETDTATLHPGEQGEVSRRLTTADTPAPRPHLLSNGQYTVMVTNGGGGFSTCKGVAVTRWRTDATRDHHGSWLYVRDQKSGRVWSAGHHPVCAPADSYEVIFSADKAEFRRRDGKIETHLDIAVAPDQDAEVRRLTIANHDTKSHTLEVMSYVEVVMQDPRADLAHPAFGKLFLETEWLPQSSALLCRRRPRSSEQPPLHAVHVLATDVNHPGRIEFETDRASFLGRRRSAANPEGLVRRLNGTLGPVLDPVFVLRQTVVLAPGTSATLMFTTALTQTRDDALALADHYRDPVSAARAFDLAWAHSRVQLRHLGITPAESHLFQRLAGHVLYPPTALRSTDALRVNRQGQQGLWRFGISGDLPLLVLAATDSDGIALARHVLKAHAFWRGRGFPVDLVLLANRPATYRDDLFQDLAALARASDSRDLIDRPGGVFVRKVQPGSEEEVLLLATARVVLYGDHGTLGDQMDVIASRRQLPPPLVPIRPAEPDVAGPTPHGGVLFPNGTGGFTSDGREYLINATPPAPWANVIANPSAGCLATDSGLGCTWVGNSQANRLTPWSNDPVSDPPSEVVYIRDEETGHFWSPALLPVRGGPATVHHGSGYTTYARKRDGLATELTVFVPVTDPVKILLLRVTNQGKATRNLSATYFAEWVLGTTREQTGPFVVTEVDPNSGALFARCAFDPDFGGAVAFADTSVRPRSVTGDRSEFLGRNRSTARPAALDRVGLSDHAGPGLDPCAALHGRFEIAPAQTAVVVFVLGQTANTESAGRLARQYRDPAAATAALEEVIATWDRRLSTVRVKTPDMAFDVLVNRWLLYQVLGCRLWGRSAFYQSGGAYGFRDQLQDVMALVEAEPSEARAHLLRAAARQFSAGDVQHWWHPPSGRGVRTRFSDDFLWLPYAVARYVEVTGDKAVLDEPVEYLRGQELEPGEQEKYYLPEHSGETESLYRHCVRALAHGWALGSHGIPLMGCGDWNDGMNLVGAGGKGESVWVGWFQIRVRNEFAALAAAYGDEAMCTALRAQAIQLRDAIESHGWDGGWYLRAWFDDGTPLGSHLNDECQIDSLTQSWAVLSGAGDADRAERGVEAAVDHLFDRENRLVKLFSPPFDTGPLHPGYIKGYVPGIRENGGQYTHAAVWLAQALAKLGRGGEGVALWQALNPISHTNTPAGVARYRVEPYVVAADVYGLPPHTGRGGWTWYTGSAAWLYRTAVETILGFTRRGDHLTFDPRIPADWQEFEIEYRYQTTLYQCRIENPQGIEHGVAEVWLDGLLIPDGIVALRDDGNPHSIRVILRG